MKYMCIDCSEGSDTLDKLIADSWMYSTKKKVFEQPPAKFLQPGADTFFA